MGFLICLSGQVGIAVEGTRIDDVSLGRLGRVAFAFPGRAAARRAVDLEPLRQTANHLLVRDHAGAGNRAQALRSLRGLSGAAGRVRLAGGDIAFCVPATPGACDEPRTLAAPG